MTKLAEQSLELYRRLLKGWVFRQKYSTHPLLPSAPGYTPPVAQTGGTMIKRASTWPFLLFILLSGRRKQALMQGRSLRERGYATTIITSAMIRRGCHVK